jgi:hypothetical protein
MSTVRRTHCFNPSGVQDGKVHVWEYDYDTPADIGTYLGHWQDGKLVPVVATQETSDMLSSALKRKRN